MMRTAVFVDGYNVFYGLLANTMFKWLDLPSLIAFLLREQDPANTVVSIDYFTSPVKPALASRGQESQKAQHAYLRALKARGVTIHEGRHRLEKKRAPRYVEGKRASRQDQVDVWHLEEKETDVNLAITLYRTAARQIGRPVGSRINQVVLVSGDTDMTPVLRAVREDFPSLKVGVIIPHRTGIEREPPGSLREHAHWMRRHISSEELGVHQFPNRVATERKPADRPGYW